MPTPGDMVLLGVITGAHGIKGEVRLKSFAGVPSAIGEYGSLVTSTGQPIEIVALRPQKGDFIAALKGVTNRNCAEALKGRELFVPRQRLPRAGADEVYVHDIIGLTAQLTDGRALGEIVAMPNFGAGDLLEVRIEGRTNTLLIPFADPFVPEFDAGRRLVVVDLPEGYLDESE